MVSVQGVTVQGESSTFSSQSPCKGIPNSGTGKHSQLPASLLQPFLPTLEVSVGDCSKLIMVADAWFDSEHENQISWLTYDITSLRSGDLNCIVIS